MSRRPLSLAVAAVAITGCASMSGLSGGSGYSCKAPEGVACDSMSGVYANSLADRLPARRAVPTSSGSPSPAPVAAPRVAMAPATSVVATLPTSASTLRSPARVLRLWVKPWEDADGDLIDQSYVYVQVDSGQWLIEHAQRQIREAYAPVKPPPRLLKPDASPQAGGPQGPAAAVIPKAAGVLRPSPTSDAQD